MVTVGDHARTRGEKTLDPSDGVVARHAREPVLDARPVARAADLGFVERPRQQRAELVLRILVKQEHTREIRLRRPQKLQPVGFRTREGPLVGPHDPGVVFLEAELREETDPLEGRARGCDITLTHHVVAGLGVLDQDALRAPGIENASDPAVVSCGFVGDFAGQLEADCVVGIAIEEARALVGGDHVVGRHDHRRQVDAAGVVANGSERKGNGHRTKFSLQFGCGVHALPD